MRIALVQPPNPQRAGKWKEQKVSRPPINLALLASCVRASGHEPFIYDLDWCEKSPSDMVELILSQSPDMVGFTCLTPRMSIVLHLCLLIKKLNPEVKITIGGAHVNGVREQALYSCIDYVVYGEAEEALVELMSGSIPEHIQNLIYHNKDRININPPRPFIQNLDRLPFPAWDLLDLELYQDPGTFDGIHMGVMTTRGCPWNCIFCSSGVTWGRKVRFRSVDNVVEELEQIVHKLGIRNIMFYDDTFTLNKTRFLKICDRIAGLNIKYYCQLRVDTVDKDVAEGLAKSGCIIAAIGAESGDNEILKVLQKGITVEQVKKAVKVLKEAGVPVLASYILGSPGDTHDTIRKTIELARQLDTDQTKFMICTPFPGSTLFDMAVKEGLLSYDITPDQYAQFTYYQHIVANMSDVSDEDIINYQNAAYRSLE